MNFIQMKITFLFALLCIGISGLAQPFSYHDDFATHDAQIWPQPMRTSHTFTGITAGSMAIERTTHDGHSSFVFSGALLVPETDFSIECEFTQVAGDINNGFGLNWISANEFRSNSFLISSNGHYRIATYHHDHYSQLTEWIFSPFIKPFGQTNRMKITQKGVVTNFYINDSLLLSTEAVFPFFGGNIGFEAGNLITISVDNLTVQQDETVIHTIPDAPQTAEKFNPGAPVNSEMEELMPIVSPDGSTLYFCRNNNPPGSGEQDSDIWYALKQADGSWGKPHRMGKPLNNNVSNAVFSVSADNNKLVLMNQYYPDGELMGPGFSIATRNGKIWNAPENIHLTNFHNKSKYTSACLSASEKYLIVSIDGDGSYGNLDLYVSVNNGYGIWSPLVNLGCIINTNGEEITPFLAPDEVTLYFSSNGRNGYGNNDIYVTKRLDDTWINWSPPLNLGPAINTPDWDAYFVISANEQTAYMTTSEHTLGYTDIIRIKLPETAKPNPVVLVKGHVYNSKTNEPMSASIRYETLTDGNERGEAASDIETGYYQIMLPVGSDYGFHAESKGYLSVNEQLTLSTDSLSLEITHDLYLVPIEIGQTIQLHNVFFAFGKAELLASSYPELDRLVEIMLQNHSMAIELGGHTDNQGSAELNQQLSAERVQSVIKHLVSKGVPVERLSGKGYGFSQPLVPNDTEANRQLNRRVEFKIVKR